MSTSDTGKLQQYLVTGLLVAAAFAIGMLYTEVKYLKNGTVAGANTAQLPTGAPPVGSPTGPQENPSAIPPVSEDDYIRGNPNAEVTLIEYSDYECPFCNQFHQTMLQVMNEYGDKVNWVYRHYPLTAIHPNAEPAAVAAECVGKVAGNDAFWKYSDLLFQKSEGEGLDQSKFVAWAEEVGANGGEVESCIESGEFTQKVADQMNAGSAAGIAGTPGTVIVTKDGGVEIISGALPFAQVKTTLDKYVQ